ncbi:MAG: GxxExxY protein [Coraliomargarita sp.]
MNELSDKIIGAAIEVHRELGPGLLEGTYEACLTHELNLQGIKAIRQERLPIHYKGLEIDEAYWIDVIIEDQIILELKVVDQLNDIHLAQLLTYLKLSGFSLGYLINFNVPLLKDGIRRVVNNHAD